MKSIKKILVLLFLISLVFSCNVEDNIEKEQNSVENELLTQKRYNPPWIFIMDARFGRENCGAGAGVCFRNDDGDILNYGILTADMGDIIYGITRNGTGTIGYQRHGNRLNLVFSKSLEEDRLIIQEDIVLREDLARELGTQQITILAGEYSLSFENLEYGETSVPILVEEIQLDYHNEYGQVNTRDYPVGRGFSLDDFLEDLELNENDLAEYHIIQANFTGVAYAEHLIDGELVYVFHQYNNEPVYIFEATLQNGEHSSMYRVSWCGNNFRPWYERQATLDFFWAFIDFGCWWC